MKIYPVILFNVNLEFLVCKNLNSVKVNHCIYFEDPYFLGETL